MSGFTPAERVEVDRHFRTLVEQLHQLDPKHPPALRALLARAEREANDATLARVLVAAELLRGIAAEGRSPLTIRRMTLSGGLAAALAEAERMGRAIGPHAHGRRKGLLALLSRPKAFGTAGKDALMRCRAIGAALDRRHHAAQPGTAVVSDPPTRSA